MPLSDYDREHIGELIGESCPACGGAKGRGSWFTAQLLRLIAKADRENLQRLAWGFPEEVQAYLDWMREGDDE